MTDSTPRRHAKPGVARCERLLNAVEQQEKDIMNEQRRRATRKDIMNELLPPPELPATAHEEERADADLRAKG